MLSSWGRHWCQRRSQGRPRCDTWPVPGERVWSRKNGGPPAGRERGPTALQRRRPGSRRRLCFDRSRGGSAVSPRRAARLRVGRSLGGTVDGAIHGSVRIQVQRGCQCQPAGRTRDPETSPCRKPGGCAIRPPWLFAGPGVTRRHRGGSDGRGGGSARGGVGAAGRVDGGSIPASRTIAGRRTGPWRGYVRLCRFLETWRQLPALAGAVRARNIILGGSDGGGVGAAWAVGTGAVAASRTIAGRRTGPWRGDVRARGF